MAGVTDYETFHAPRLAGLHVPFEEGSVGLFNDGATLLNRYRRPGDTVAVLDFDNPFSYALGMKPPNGGTAWLHYGINFDAIHKPTPERIFGDAKLVLLPKEYKDFQFRDNDNIPRLYGPYLREHFALIGESKDWQLYRRNTG
jgi:hypothetical protein